MFSSGVQAEKVQTEGNGKKWSAKNFLQGAEIKVVKNCFNPHAFQNVKIHNDDEEH